MTIRNLKVRVLKRHINKGVCRNINRCAVALAVMEQTHRKCKVNGIDVRVRWRTGVVTKYNLPDNAQEFISTFDNQKSLAKPIRFTATRAD